MRYGGLHHKRVNIRNFDDYPYLKLHKIFRTLPTPVHQYIKKFGHNCAGWPTKMSLFFFGNNFSKNKEAFKIFFLQILKVYSIVLVETTLESVMFYYTFSVINNRFVPCTALLYGSTVVTRTLKLSITRYESVPWEVMSGVFKC